MSSTGTSTNYQFTFNLDGTSLSINGGFEMSTGATTNDALALEILQALNGVAWPAGVTKPVSVMKVTDTFVSSTPDLAATPPAFT